jgi:thiamine transporter
MTRSVSLETGVPAGRRLRWRLNANPARWSVPVVAEMGVAVALSVVLGFVRLYTMPQGGSVSLEMLPVVFVAVRRGLVPGIATGVVYGLLQIALPGAFVYQPMQAVLYLAPEAVLTVVVLWPLLRAYDAAFPQLRQPQV